MASESPRTPPPASGGPLLSRRSLLKTGAGAIAGGAVLSGADVGPADLDAISPTGEAEALAPVAWAGIAGGTMATAWFLHEIDVIGGEDPGDDLAGDTLLAQIYQAALKRKSVNKSTFTDNRNLVDYLPEAAYSEGKLAALEAIEDDATEDEAINEGREAANKQFATVEENLIKSWNESVAELETFWNQLKDNSDVDEEVDPWNLAGSSDDFHVIDIEISEEDLTLADDSTTPLKSIYVDGYATGTAPYQEWSMIEEIGTDESNGNNVWSPTMQIRFSLPGGDVDYLRLDDWKPLWDDLQSTISDVNDNISLWVSNVYDEIQSGELSPSEYLSGTDLANSIAADEEDAQAIGDLIAMNVPGDFGQEATVTLSEDDATLKGYLATTDTTNVSGVEEGDEIDPQATDSDDNDLYGTWYLAYRPGTYIEEWEDYDDDYGIQGGELRLTADPTTTDDGISIEESLEYVIETAADETAEVPPSDFEEDEDGDGDAYWSVDLSDELDETITDVDRIRVVYDGDSPDTYQTMILDQLFTVEDIEGDSSSLDIQENREPQSDDNYIDEEKWAEISDQQEELIDRWEEETAPGGGTAGDSFLDDLPRLGLFPDWIPGGKAGEYAILALLGLFGFNVATN